MKHWKVINNKQKQQRRIQRQNWKERKRKRG